MHATRQMSLENIQFSSVAQLCPTLHDPMDHSTPGLPVHHQLPGLAQTQSIELVMPSNRLILCRPLLLLPSVFPRIRGSFSISIQSNLEVTQTGVVAPQSSETQKPFFCPFFHLLCVAFIFKVTSWSKTAPGASAIKFQGENKRSQKSKRYKPLC